MEGLSSGRWGRERMGATASLCRYEEIVSTIFTFVRNMQHHFPIVLILVSIL